MAARQVARRIIESLEGGSKTSQRVKVFIGFSIITGLSTYLVLSKPTKAGHSLASVEKPQALRGEVTRSVEDERAKAAAAAQAKSKELN